MTNRKRTTFSTDTPALDRVNAYAESVLSGGEVAGPLVRAACRRHMDDMARCGERGFHWDDEAAMRVFRFFEERLKLSEGQFEGIPFLLHPSQAFKLGSIYGWIRNDGSRRYRTVYIEEGKGNGKSPFAGGVGLFGMIADREAGAQIYAAAAKKEQADILFRDAVKMRDKAPALRDRIKCSGGPGREYNMAHLATGSFFRPISKEAGKSGSGPRPHYALCDEVHEHPDRGIMEMLQRGFKFRRQPLLLMITNSGSDRNSVCWEERTRAVQVVCGTRTPDEDYAYVGETWDGSDSVFAYICALDKNDDPLRDRTCWKKANPLLGTILTEDYLAGVVAEARNVPGKLNNILRLHFCVWTEADTSWLARELIDAVTEEFDPYELHKGKTVSAAGIDLSGAKDLTAAAFVVETGVVDVEREDGTVATLPTYDAWIEAWTPRDTMDERAKADHVPYRLWFEKGYLHAPEGQRIRYDHVAAHFAKMLTTCSIAVLAYDRYVFDKFQEELDEYGVDIPTVMHPQGGKKRARPDDAKVETAKANNEEPPLGLWMPGSVSALETLILEKRIRLRKSPVLMTALMGVAMETDPLMGNQWFSKKKSTVRIDPAVALAMAAGAAVDGAPVRYVAISPWEDPEYKIAMV
jgi:phage terminase large subunit-like protein